MASQKSMKTTILVCAAVLSAMGAAMGGPMPPVIRQGSMDLKQTWIVDFDNGMTGSRGDVWFEAVSQSEMDFEPRASALIGSAMYTNAQGAAPFGYPFCAHANYGTAPQPITPATQGAYFCVKTNGGHVAEFKVDSISGDAADRIPLVLHLTYTVWQ